MMSSPTWEQTENPARPTMVRYAVLVALCLAAAIAYLSRNCLGVAVADEQILTDLNCTQTEMGWLMGTGFFLSYSLCQIPGGWLGHIFGSRVALPLYAAVWSFMTGMMGLSFGFVSIFVVYLSIGAAQAGIFPNSANSISKWFPSSRTGLACGALGSSMSAGGAVAVFVAGIVIPLYGWRWVFALFSIPGLFWAVGFYLWFRDRPEQHSAVNDEELALICGDSGRTETSPEASVKDEEDGEQHAKIPWDLILTSPYMWIISGQQFFRGAGYIFYSTWFPTYLKETYKVSTAESGILSSLPLIAVVIASFSGGALVDWILARTGSRRLSRQCVAVASMLACGGFIGLAYFVTSAHMAVLLISAGSFCASFAGPCAYAVTIDMAGKQVPVVFSIMNMSGNIGAAVCPVLVIEFVDATGGQWEYVLFLFAGIYVAAAFCWGLLNPNGKIFGSKSEM